MDDNLTVSWRGEFANAEVNELHAEAFETRVFDESELNWEELTANHSLGWVTARDGDRLIGFVNVLWDGHVHAWIQDVMVSNPHQRKGIGVRIVADARDQAKAAGCEWLHVDFDDDLADFYYSACGFSPAKAGLIDLT